MSLEAAKCKLLGVSELVIDDVPSACLFFLFFFPFFRWKGVTHGVCEGSWLSTSEPAEISSDGGEAIPEAFEAY